MPERSFRQEILAEFLEDGGGVFRGVVEAARAERREPYIGHFVMGADWGRSNDYTVLTVIDAKRQAVVDYDRFTGVGWALQYERVKTLFEKWKPVTILAESNSIGTQAIEALQAKKIPVQGFHTSNASKNQIIENLVLAIERGMLTYPHWEVLISELQAYEQERMSSGLIRYNAPEGQHDDTVISLALALWAANGGNRVHQGSYLLARNDEEIEEYGNPYD